MKIYYYFSIFLLVITTGLSCSDENSGTEPKPEIGQEPENTPGANINSTYLITNECINIPLKEIDSLNIETGKLTLKRPIPIDSVSDIEFGEKRFMIDGRFYFSLYFTTGINSAIINNSVFYYNEEDQSFYITDGYPPSELFGTDPYGVLKIREMHKKVIKNGWEDFISVLKNNHTPVIEPDKETEIPEIENSFKITKDSIILYKQNIKSFIPEIGKLNLYNKIPFDSILSISFDYHKFYIDSLFLFEVYITPTSNSQIIDGPTLLYDNRDSSLYIWDGYPMSEVLGYMKENAQKSRDEKMKAIEGQWNKFLEYINK